MDVTALRDRIQCTLDANTSIRQQAELDLKYVRHVVERTWDCETNSGGPSPPFLGRISARFYQCAVGYPTGRAEQCRSALW